MTRALIFACLLVHAAAQSGNLNNLNNVGGGRSGQNNGQGNFQGNGAEFNCKEFEEALSGIVREENFASVIDLCNEREAAGDFDSSDEAGANGADGSDITAAPRPAPTNPPTRPRTQPTAPPPTRPATRATAPPPARPATPATTRPPRPTTPRPTAPRPTTPKPTAAAPTPSPKPVTQPPATPKPAPKPTSKPARAGFITNNCGVNLMANKGCMEFNGQSCGAGTRFNIDACVCDHANNVDENTCKGI